MGLINPKPRFAYDDTANQVYDYLVQKDVPLEDRYKAPDGVWNLNEVKRLILAGLPCEGALVSKPDPKAKGPPPKAPVPPAGSGLQTASTGGKESKKAGGSDLFPKDGLSAEQLGALKLTPLQAAALGLTRSQMDVVGVPASTIKGWAITPERAEALKLTEAQRDALMIHSDEDPE
jgi:hypothetical protein